MARTGLSRRDIDRAYTALRPRLGGGSGSGGTLTVTIPAHTHSADQIGLTPAGDVAGDDVQEGIEELAEEKLARDGHQPMTGDLDMDQHDLVDVTDADIEGTATVGGEIVQTGAVGSATISGTRKITMEGAEADGEGRIEEINALAFNPVTPTPEIGRMAWDDVEDTIVVFVASGA